MHKQIDVILEKVSDVTGVTVEEIKSKKRHKMIAVSKSIVYILCRDFLKLGYSDIARIFKINHATVMHHCNKVRNDKLYISNINEIKRRLNFTTKTEIDILKDTVAYLSNKVEYLTNLIQELDITNYKKEKVVYKDKNSIMSAYDKTMLAFVTNKDKETRCNIVVDMYNLGVAMKKFDKDKAQMYLNEASSTSKLLGHDILDLIKK